MRPLAPVRSEGARRLVLDGVCPFDHSRLVFCMFEGSAAWLECQTCGRSFEALPERIAVRPKSGERPTLRLVKPSR
jgi:hypothetical protein